VLLNLPSFHFSAPVFKLNAIASSATDDGAWKQKTIVSSCPVTDKESINFAGGSTSLTKKSQLKIAQLAKDISSCGYKKVDLYGYTSIDKPDTPGYALFRKSLSEKRAKVVKDAINKKIGKSSKSIKYKIVGKSNANPLKSNKSEKTRSVNRRVEVTLKK
jgi:outer membrane protein OmpA-like peptidoglycan-associated protein